VTQHPDLIVGLDDADDAAVYMTPSGDALVQTVDFFTPVVDEPFDWGRIAAANALSDVYAMGGVPITALQLVGWPRDELPFSILEEVIAGGASVLEEAGCTLVGGHSVDDQEPKYGFAVTGLLAPERIQTNSGARAGDRLVLTKPLGSGIVATGIKQGVVDPALRDRAVAVMAALNAAAAEAMSRVDAHAATDVTGFGLLGHLRELLESTHAVGAVITVSSVPVIEGVRALAAAGVYPGGSERNLAYVAPIVDGAGIDDVDLRILADAQTSGGLLISVPEREFAGLMEACTELGVEAVEIGGFVPEHEGRIRLV